MVAVFSSFTTVNKDYANLIFTGMQVTTKDDWAELILKSRGSMRAIVPGIVISKKRRFKEVIAKASIRGAYRKRVVVVPATSDVVSALGAKEVVGHTDKWSAFLEIRHDAEAIIEKTKSARQSERPSGETSLSAGKVIKKVLGFRVLGF